MEKSTKSFRPQPNDAPQTDGDRIHQCHRKRLRARFLADRGGSMEDHELLELLLFYSRERINTNPLAHRLIDRFGSLQGVLDAGYEELLSCPQVGENTAVLLKLLPVLLNRYSLNKRTETPIIYDTEEKLGEFLYPTSWDAPTNR